MSDWRPMSSAPKDGTIILVCETGNGEVWRAWPACWMAPGDCADIAGWWILAPSRSSDETLGIPTKVRWYASTPVCWKPMPQPEPVPKLRRRYAQILSTKYGKRAKPKPSGSEVKHEAD